MHRFYFPSKALSQQKEISLTATKELHHLQHVLRLKKGNDICLFNGKGEEVLGQIHFCDSKEVIIRVLSKRKESQRLPLLILACAIPKKSKFELIIEKATELGVDEIFPLMTKRSEVQLRGDKIDKKHFRYQTVAVNASKQSQRTFIPTIHPPLSFNQFLNSYDDAVVRLIPSLVARRNPFLKTLSSIQSPRRIAVLIGPEGDFTPEEYNRAFKKGWIPVSLGQTILKVETAAICALSSLNLFYHDK